MRAAASEIGCSLAQVALAWNLHQPGVTATLAGTTNPSHVRDNADAASIILTTAQLAVLNEWIPLGPTFAAG
jgi:aryl-alcohol dehydrogenase-like predicted oxidoreductase